MRKLGGCLVVGCYELMSAWERERGYSPLVEGDEQPDRATVKHVWNVAMHVLHTFWGFVKTQHLTTWGDTAIISFIY